MNRNTLLRSFAAAILAVAAFGQSMSPTLKAKVESRAAQLKMWGTDAVIVAAVREANTNPPAETKSMTNEQWAKLTVLDPLVRGYSKNALAQHLKSKQTDEITECFVSAAAGTKVAFLSKTTYWSHADKEKHKAPMSGKIWIGPAEVDQSTGQLQVQVGVPVLDGGKPIGSIVVGLSVAKLH